MELQVCSYVLIKCLFAGKQRPKAAIKEVPDEDLGRSQYHASDPEPEESSSEPEVSKSSSDEQDDGAPLMHPKPKGKSKPKKCKHPRKQCKANPSNNNVDDADIEMIDVDGGSLQVDDDLVKDISHFFSASYMKDRQKIHDCHVCP